MGKKKGNKPQFKPNTVVFATDPMGEEVSGVVHRTIANVLYLRALTEQGVVHTISVPLETHRVVEVPERHGLGGLVEAMHDVELIDGKKIIPFIPLLPKSDDVLRKLRSKEREEDVIIALLNHHGQAEIARVASNRGDPHRFIALGLLESQESYLAIFKDPSEHMSDRERAIRQITSQELVFELALSPDNTLAYMAMECVRDRELRLRLYLESPRVIKSYLGSFNSLDQCLEDGDYERLVLDAKCFDNRRHALEYVRDPEALERCLNALIERVPTWNMTREDLHHHAILTSFILQRLKRFVPVIWEKLARILVPNHHLAINCITATLRTATPDERIRIIETLRQKSAPGAYGIPPRAKITQQVVDQVCKKNGWRIS